MDVEVAAPRYRKKFLKSLSKEERRLCSRKIPCASLLMLAMSPWRNLLASEVYQALITMTCFDGVSFTSLLQKFAPLFDDYPFNTSHILLKQDPLKGGCSRKVCPELGCAFRWNSAGFRRNLAKRHRQERNVKVQSTGMRYNTILVILVHSGWYLSTRFLQVEKGVYLL